MARTTVDDCLTGDDSHFDLAYTVPRRAREILRSGEAAVQPGNDKPIVVALRERAMLKQQERTRTRDEAE